MSELPLFAALLLTAIMALGLTRVIIGPSSADRMMAAQLVATSGVAVLLLLAPAIAVPGLVDVALVLALLAGVAAIAFTRRRSGQRSE